MKICAITGSSGILGQKIKKKLPFKFHEFKGDISKWKDVKKWIHEKDFDLLIHLAARVPTKKVALNYKKALEINCLGTKNIVNSLKSKKNKPKWVFFSSTSHVYNSSKKNLRIKESTRLCPSSKYGMTKKKGEFEIIKLKESNINYCIGRIFSFTDIRQKTPYVIPTLIKKIKDSKHKEIILRNMNHYRDFISTNNICKIILKLYKTNSKGIYNIGSGQGICIKEIAMLIGLKYKKIVKFIDNDDITYLISNNKRILAKGIKLNKFTKNIDFFYK